MALLRAERSTLQDLVDQGLIRSADQMAKYASSVIADVQSTAHPDEDLRRLDRSLYKAFRNRRSLLLLNFESQVRLDELPWAKPIMSRRSKASDAPKRAAAELALCAFRGFPQTILPNPFLSQMSGLLGGEKGAKVPLTMEVAADIFCHGFTPTFENAAQVAWTAVRGTCYARYFDLQAKDYDTKVSFYQRCKTRAHGYHNVGAGGGRGVADNGIIIEQAAILTTHNLAVLFDQLDLKDKLKMDLLGLAVRCWKYICMSLRRMPVKGAWKPRLQAIKNIAFATRQLLFFMSMLPASEAAGPFLVQAEEILEQEPSATVKRKVREELLPRLRESLLPPVPAGGPMMGWSLGGHKFLEGL